MPMTLTLGIGEIRTLYAQPQNGGTNVKAKMSWTNSSAATVQDTVSTDGLSCQVMGLAAGSATITAAIVGASVSDAFAITVPASSPDTLALSIT